MKRLWKNWVLLILGLWIIVLPSTGFPGKIFLFRLSGFVVVVMAFALAHPQRNISNEEATIGEKIIQA